MGLPGFRGNHPCGRWGIARRVAPVTAPPAAGCRGRGRAGVPAENDRRSASTPVEDAAPVPASWRLVVLRHGGPALGLAQTSPDPVRLTDAQCVVETRLPHCTGCANGFRLLFPAQLLALPLEVRRWKEDDRLRTAACSPNLPVFLDALCTHRHTPLPRRTIQPVLTRNKKKLLCGQEPSRRRCPRSAALSTVDFRHLQLSDARRR
jgi:hypothetical protein